MSSTSAIEEAKVRFTTTHKTTKEIKGHKKTVASLAWSSRGKLASASHDCSAKVWTISGSSSRREIELNGHTGHVTKVLWDPTNANVLATASSDKSVRLWDIRSNGAQKQLHKIPTPGENINLAWRPDGTHIVIGNKEDVISVIDVRTHKILKHIRYKHYVNEMMWDKTGKSLFMTTGDGHVEVYNYDMENNGANIPLPRVRQIQAHARDVFCIDFDPTGKYFAVGSEDALVSLWSLPEYVPVRGISRCEEPIKSVSFSCDGQFLACSSKEIIDITHLETGEQAHMIDTKTEKDKDPENQVEIKPVNSLTWHPSELLLAYAKDSCISIFGYKE